MESALQILNLIRSDYECNIQLLKNNNGTHTLMSQFNSFLKIKLYSILYVKPVMSKEDYTCTKKLSEMDKYNSEAEDESYEPPPKKKTTQKKVHQKLH